MGKVKIRSGVFETNSSSIHTICIPTRDKELVFPQGSSITFGLDEFGWEEDHLKDQGSRATYLWTAICYSHDQECDKEYLDNAQTRIREILSKVGVTCAFVDPSSGVDYYIDHGSEAADLFEFLTSDESLLMKYLFDDDSFVHTGNDNDDSGDYEADPIRYHIYVKGN